MMIASAVSAASARLDYLDLLFAAPVRMRIAILHTQRASAGLLPQRPYNYAFGFIPDAEVGIYTSTGF